MKLLKLLTLLTLLALGLSSCVFSGDEIEPGDIAGCYLTSIPDPFSPDDYPPTVDFYIQLWEDGTGEGGFWGETLMESHFFTWEIEDDTLIFTSDFSMFDNTIYYVSINPLDGQYDVIAEQNDELLATFTLSSEAVSHVEYTNEQIIGTWIDGQTNYTFSADSLTITDRSPTTWTRGDIPYTIETGYGAEWAVRMFNGELAIMAGYNSILLKQP